MMQVVQVVQVLPGLDTAFVQGKLGGKNKLKWNA